jgi:hypothetical protein
MIEAGGLVALAACAGLAVWLSLAAILASGLARFAADSNKGRVLLLVLVLLVCFAGSSKCLDRSSFTTRRHGISTGWTYPRRRR